ncbi:hypothetical protein TTHERM_000827019 (macronuclear) [Tetrahymena thermophila SB210]|uniref:Uncharacterized protein n=1 Tax=Tetrahymena thermophila (strain SB210) TaxID=312017 RepID=W7XCE2_TETTS|nr:hypothetical protein TTHERM_000827019 [Tetrahymena thermophila SB210]EWS74218.1 hypothetical protein TTHERM_000827019 [Tetrahymena thermophila SB210]|eukprot:XP_012653246.1 hypothetical protein TTHERM_000827019 [Tetrahymena thermophila SB210]
MQLQERSMNHGINFHKNKDRSQKQQRLKTLITYKTHLSSIIFKISTAYFAVQEQFKRMGRKISQKQINFIHNMQQISHQKIKFLNTILLLHRNLTGIQCSFILEQKEKSNTCFNRKNQIIQVSIDQDCFQIVLDRDLLKKYVLTFLSLKRLMLEMLLLL